MLTYFRARGRGGGGLEVSDTSNQQSSLALTKST